MIFQSVKQVLLSVLVSIGLSLVILFVGHRGEAGEEGLQLSPSEQVVVRSLEHSHTAAQASHEYHLISEKQYQGYRGSYSKALEDFVAHHTAALKKAQADLQEVMAQFDEGVKGKLPTQNASCQTPGRNLASPQKPVEAKGRK